MIYKSLLIWLVLIWKMEDGTERPAEVVHLFITYSKALELHLVNDSALILSTMAL